jgi:hypothetical protein
MWSLGSLGKAENDELSMQLHLSETGRLARQPVAGLIMFC